MNKIMFLLITFCIVHFTYADPFDRQQRSHHSTSNVQKHNLLAEQTCFTQQASLFADTALQDLKLIGMIEQNKQWKAFFLDKNQHIISVKPEDIISQERLKIAQIGRKQVISLRAATNNCQQFSQVILTL